MARVTVEDCLRNQQNRFDLTIEASARARALELGADDPKVPRDNDKPTVIALREIADGYVFNDEGLVEGEENSAEDDPYASTVDPASHFYTKDILTDTDF